MDNESGELCLTNLLSGTMVFLYDSQGELREKHQFALPLLTITVSKQGTYVLVMSHPNCQPEVQEDYLYRDIKEVGKFLGKPTDFLFFVLCLISEY